jgi:hypothetical protein
VEIVDRYLQAVKAWLPSEQRDDILAELSEDLRSELEEREAALGRPLGEHEAQALLEHRGHPLWLARGYATGGHLIGPMVLPTFRRVVAIALPCLAVIFASLWVVFRFVVEQAPHPPLRSGFFWLWQGGLYALALVGLYTMIFAAIERTHARVRASDAWDPRHPGDLPTSVESRAARERFALRLSAAGDLVGALVFTLCWVGLWRLPDVPEIELTLAPVFAHLYAPILALGLAEIALATAALVRPRPGRTRSLLSVARYAAGVVLAGTALAAGSWILLAVPGAPADRIALLARWLNLSVAATVGVFGALYLAFGIHEARALVRTLRGQPSH